MYDFTPDRHVAQDLLREFDISNYSKTRNFIDGTVSKLSPYITHGILTLPEIYGFVFENFEIGRNHKFIKELAWREFFFHVWERRNNQIFSSINPGIIDNEHYSLTMPSDIKNACTGINTIDKIIRSLYKFGYIHNHARLWLASYIVHLRKIHWKIGATWLYSYLLDGDLASNFLSWQWVAGTFSGKPYLFNADNVTKYAPKEWQCLDSMLNISYEGINKIAFSTGSLPEGGNGKKIAPKTSRQPFQNIPIAKPNQLENVWIIHPWNIRETSEKFSGMKKVGVFFEEFHHKWAWSEKRWNFVLKNMEKICDEIYFCPRSLFLVNVFTEENLHLKDALSNKEHKIFFEEKKNIWIHPELECSSFTKFWKKVENLNFFN